MPAALISGQLHASPHSAAVAKSRDIALAVALARATLSAYFGLTAADLIHPQMVDVVTNAEGAFGALGLGDSCIDNTYAAANE